MGVAVAPHGRLAIVITFVLTGDHIAELGIVAEPERLRNLHLIDPEPG